MLLFLETGSQVIKKGGSCFFSYSHTSCKQTPLGPEKVSVYLQDVCGLCTSTLYVAGLITVRASLQEVSAYRRCPLVAVLLYCLLICDK